MKKVVIVGGGIAGLATAYYLQTRARATNAPIEYQLIESAPTFGGKIVSARADGFVVEGGPDSFIAQKPAALELCRALGLGDQLIGTNDAARKVFVWSRGQLRPMPAGMNLIVPTRITPFLTSSLVSWGGKLRMGLELFIPPRRDDGDESLAHFVRRRLGAEALDKIAEPMIAGIYVADAEDLSLQSTFPRFLEMEKKYGSLIRGMRQQPRPPQNGKAATSMFMTLRDGLQELVEALLDQLDHDALLLNRRVVALRRDAGAYHIALNDGAAIRADAVVFATPAYVSAELLQAIAPELASALRAIGYVSTATVSLGFRRAELSHSLEGFGFVVPSSERRKITACTWSSTKFNHRAPDGYALVRGFIGGAHAEALMEQDDAALVQTVRDELRAMMGITATPVLTKVFRWHKANPQYAVGHQARVSAIERLAAQHTGLYLAGAAYHGVGIPDCIADGARVAAQLLKLEEP
ncbi:MAG: protoporphyrinogen oxidase [Chloroflexi bacterium]|nr:protoporphyrinogen oxidase [Chloroflexota bacterium]